MPSPRPASRSQLIGQEGTAGPTQANQILPLGILQVSCFNSLQWSSNLRICLSSFELNDPAGSMELEVSVVGKDTTWSFWQSPEREC